MQDQDLAALQRIPHVCLGFAEFSTLLLTRGSWQSLQIRGEAGFSVEFYNAGRIVRSTERFLFECTSQEAGAMYRVLRAACTRQEVACHECEHPQGFSRSPGGVRVASLSNVKLCRNPVHGRTGDSCIPMTTTGLAKPHILSCTDKAANHGGLLFWS